MPDLPSGTVTFVFSDLEGSTKLLKQLGDEGYARMLATHRAIVRETFAAHGGSEIDTQGDAFFYSFSRARGAVAAAVDLQRRHETQEWPGGARVRVRLGLHTGEPVVGDEGYTGLDVVRAARIAADGDGGQILLSESTRAIVGNDLPEGVDVRELGERTLKDLDRPEPLYELVYSSEPPGVGVPESSELPELPELPGLPVPAGSTSPDINIKLDPTNISGWLGIARQAIRDGEKFDPGPLIEQRVLQQIEENMRHSDERRAAKDERKKDKAKGRSAPPDIPDFAMGKPPPGVPAGNPLGGKSVTDELERLRKLRDDGALNDEQYARAVDRVLGEG